MNAIPQITSGLELDPTGEYACPLCKVQRAGDEVDIGWVECPIADNQMICLGSCLDYQAAARALSFATSAGRELFGRITKRTRQVENDLRATCLRHQASVIDERFRVRSENMNGLIALRKQVFAALADCAS
jgi:hypothetical protein